MRVLKRTSVCLKCILVLTLLLSVPTYTNAQLKKVAKIEKVKSFTNGSVALNKTIIDEVEVYSVTLPNNSKYHQPIVFFLGSKDEMIKNLKDLSEALETGTKGEVFDFTVCGKKYQLSFSRSLGQKCFKITGAYKCIKRLWSFFQSNDG
ncbi:hypothetical protein [Parabacteroides chongii]|uniref:hypothetical protein n=1 Tax=Parabacteroides chongii TaxID=2685834 RepID=UPI00240D8483|nr:hypothetical protein [Parabacteroides chongii]WFE86165.1 hypothetical protein P3L47_06060 [Parabacteroides chongii]